MDDDNAVLLADFIESRANCLAVGHEQLLRDNLRQLEEACKLRKEFKDHQGLHEDELMRRLWLHLIEVGVRTGNVQLCLVLVAKLKLVQLALVLKAALQPQAGPILSGSRETVALAYVSDYFNAADNNNEHRKGLVKSDDLLPPPPDDQVQSKGPRKSLLFAHEHLIDLDIDRGQWAAALNLIDRLVLDGFQNGLSKRLLSYRRAQDLELDENFEEAMRSYAQSDTGRLNVPRLIIKQNLDLAYSKLCNYCLSPANHSDDSFATPWQTNFWFKYAQLMSSARNNPINDANERPQIGSSPPIAQWQQSNFGLPKRWVVQDKTGGCFDEEFSQSLPKPIRDFINNPRLDKWTNNGKRKLDSLITLASGLSSDTRRAIAELAIRYQQFNLPARASDLCLCLEHTETIATYLSPRFMGPILSVRVAHQLGLGANIVAHNLIDHIDLRRYGLQRRNHSRNKQNNTQDHWLAGNEANSTIFLAYIKLGLINESLQVLSAKGKAQNIGEQILSQAIDHLQNVIKTSQTDGLICLDKIDPEIWGPTLIGLQKSLLLLNVGQTTNAQVLTVIILSIHIFLLKLHNPSVDLSVVGRSQSTKIQKLEIMFKGLAELYLVKLSFEASDSLVRATNNLVGAVKGRLDELADSDAIREGFRKLVETIAGKCMREGRYKSAAALYSQIEDNVSAVKSLMRMGDVDIVLDYSLLVRDITVNRLTINYLKHLNVEPEVIENFISNSKSS